LYIYGRTDKVGRAIYFGYTDKITIEVKCGLEIMSVTQTAYNLDV
jgi:hypothetical protein